MDSRPEKAKSQVYFVGAGPGAKDLITVRGRDIISSADVIIYAGSLVNPELLEYAKDDALIYNSAKMTLEEVLEAVSNDRLDISYESCPGVTAAFGAAASMDLEYTLPGISQSLILTRMAGRTDVPVTESIESWAAHKASMAIYLSTGMLEELSSRLIAGGYAEDTPAAIIYKATWPEEEYHYCSVSTLAATAAEFGIRKTALVIVGDVLAGKGYEKSRLYDRTFSTEFRKAHQDR